MGQQVFSIQYQGKDDAEFTDVVWGTVQYVNSVDQVKAVVLNHAKNKAYSDKIRNMPLLKKEPETFMQQLGRNVGLSSRFNFKVEQSQDVWIVDLFFDDDLYRIHREFKQDELVTNADYSDFSLDDFALAWDQVPEENLAIVEKKKLFRVTQNGNPYKLLDEDEELETLEDLKISAACPGTSFSYAKEVYENGTTKKNITKLEKTGERSYSIYQKNFPNTPFVVTLHETATPEEIAAFEGEEFTKNAPTDPKPKQNNPPSIWSKRIGFFLLNPFTYIAPAILIATGLMIAWVHIGTPLLVEASMLTLGSALGLGAITTGIAILINFFSMFKEKMPIEEYLAERSKWSYVGTAVGMALFLTALMVTLTLFSEQIPFLDNIFSHLLKGMTVGMGEFAKLTDVSFFASPEFLNAFSAVLKVVFVLTPAILIDTIGRFATAGEDYKYPDQYVSKQDGKKWDGDNKPNNDRDLTSANSFGKPFKDVKPESEGSRRDTNPSQEDVLGYAKVLYGQTSASASGTMRFEKGEVLAILSHEEPTMVVGELAALLKVQKQDGTIGEIGSSDVEILKSHQLSAKLGSLGTSP